MFYEDQDKVTTLAVWIGPNFWMSDMRILEYSRTGPEFWLKRICTNNRITMLSENTISDLYLYPRRLLPPSNHLCWSGLVHFALPSVPHCPAYLVASQARTRIPPISEDDMK